MNVDIQLFDDVRMQKTKNVEEEIKEERGIKKKVESGTVWASSTYEGGSRGTCLTRCLEPCAGVAGVDSI